ncbi:hypothetical protein ACHAXA_005826 [Cyclostephanos tholiformis]|uniref:Uncharacterized protein n=1 Tax=Cyclostephanos tholiformis TaxID=382380 RepID=A0ABD3RZX4_9STRA
MIPGGIMASSKCGLIRASSSSSLSRCGVVSSPVTPSLGCVGPTHLDTHPRQRRYSSPCRRTRGESVETNENDFDDADVDMMSEKDMANEQMWLHREASYLTRTLYRKCLKSIRVLAMGNDRDERDFVEREADERDRLPSDDYDAKSSEGGRTGTDISTRRRRVSMAPPVNRANELRSRADYYRAFARENFDGHFGLLSAHGFHIGDEGNSALGLGMAAGGDDDGGRGWNRYQGGHRPNLGVQMSTHCQGGGGRGGENFGLARGGGGHYMWREEQIEQFVYLIRSGEEKRRWIMNDYEFEDDAHDATTTTSDDNDGVNSPRGWSHELERRLSAFEVRSKSLVKRMYQRKGWMHSTDCTERSANDDSGFFSDSDSEEDDAP